MLGLFVVQPLLFCLLPFEITIREFYSHAFSMLGELGKGAFDSSGWGHGLDEKRFFTTVSI